MPVLTLLLLTFVLHGPNKQPCIQIAGIHFHWDFVCCNPSLWLFFCNFGICYHMEIQQIYTPYIYIYIYKSFPCFYNFFFLLITQQQGQLCFIFFRGNCEPGLECGSCLSGPALNKFPLCTRVKPISPLVVRISHLFYYLYYYLRNFSYLK